MHDPEDDYWTRSDTAFFLGLIGKLLFIAAFAWMLAYCLAGWVGP